MIQASINESARVPSLVITIGSFYPGQSDIVPYWQIYRGATITANSNDRVMKGNVVFENAVKWT